MCLTHWVCGWSLFLVWEGDKFCHRLQTVDKFCLLSLKMYKFEKYFVYLRASFVSIRQRSRRLAQQVWSWRTSWSSTVSGRRLAERSKGEQLSALRTADRSQHLLPLSFSHSFALCVSASPKAKKQLKRKLDRGVKKLRGLEKWIVELKKIFF